MESKNFLQKTSAFIRGLASDSAVLTLLIIFTFLIPLLFSPWQSINFFFAKSVPLFVVTIAALFFLIFKIFREGKYKISLHPIFAVMLFLPLWYVLSSFFSVYSKNSFIGNGIELDTASMVGLLFLFAFLISCFFRAKDKIFYMYVSFGASYVVLAVFHVIRLFFPQALTFNLFLTTISNTVGKWNELAIISGIAILLSLMSIEFLKLTRGFKIFSYVILTLSVFLVAVTNFPVLIVGNYALSFFSIIGLFALVFFVYFLSSSYEQSRKSAEEIMVDGEGEQVQSQPAPVMKKRILPKASLIVLLVSVVFTFGYQEIGTYLQTHFNVSSYEQRPTWGWTAQTAWNSIKHKPFTGYGPNNFSTSWSANKPASVAPTQVWNVDFDAGAGYIPSTIMTVGPIGFLGWLVFLIIFVFLGARALFMKFKDRFSQYLTASSFLVALFLWIMMILYTPTTVINILTFLFTGLFFGSLFREGILKERNFVFEDSKEKTFISIMVLVILLVGSIFWAYALGQQVAATSYASQAAAVYSIAANDQDLINAQNLYARAIAVSPSDIYLRAITDISINRAGLFLNDKTLSQDQLTTSFVTAYRNAYAAANGAITLNPANYQNQITRGAVSESILSLGLPSVAGLDANDAYTDGKKYYDQAAVLNPQNPLIDLLQARLELDKKNTDGAISDINKALSIKQNYPDAYLLLSQIKLGQQDTKGAIDTLAGGSVVAPDSNLFFTLGILRYNEKDYTGAVNAFENSVSLNPSYSNARYFLALSYYNTNRRDEAIAQLQIVKTLNPDNKDLDAVIDSLKKGETLPVADATNSPVANSTSTNATTTSNQ